MSINFSKIIDTILIVYRTEPMPFWRGGGLQACDVISVGGSKICDEVWQRGKGVNFTQKLRDVIYVRPHTTDIK